MRIPLIVPDLRHGDDALRVSAWFVDEGDWVVTGDLVVEVLIPGITCDIATESTGRLVEISAPIDAVIHAGDILGWIDDAVPEASEVSSEDDPLR